MTTLDLTAKNTQSVGTYIRSGQPWVWMTAAAISVAFIITVSLLALTAVRGLPHFWPSKLLQAQYQEPEGKTETILAELIEQEEVSTARLKSAGLKLEDSKPFHTRDLLKVANRDILGADFRYLLDEWLTERSYPLDAVVLERMEYGNFHGFITAVKQDGQVLASGADAFAAFKPLQERANDLRKKIRGIEKRDIGAINYTLEDLRLEARRLALEGKTPANDAEDYRKLDEKKAEQDARYSKLREELALLKKEASRDTIVVKTVDGQTQEIPLVKIVRGYQPNRMGLFAKSGLYLKKLWEFVADEPREANTEGGIFPAIFGTVMMVLLMSVFVTPFGILAALYLREYAKQGVVTQVIRIAVNNLAGVPSIVYGMFGLGFFVYFLGANIDQLFYKTALPSPTFGTPGILWSSLTLAILTLPVVIVATEEGLARIPRSLREASLALGATKAETLWKVVLPMASPAMMTGLILAIARAAGEVAPLMLVGVVKLAPSLPLDGNFPFVHLERKFMHLGFHIYDVGFQSPNVEAARPLVYATSFLLVLVIILLNVSAVRIRNRLREKYKALDS
jgi:phosphate transport system permease protein